MLLWKPERWLVKEHECKKHSILSPMLEVLKDAHQKKDILHIRELEKGVMAQLASNESRWKEFEKTWEQLLNCG